MYARGVFFLMLASVCTAASASAQAPAATAAAAHVQSPVLRHRGLSPLVEIGWYDGCVGGLQLDTGVVALRATGGYFPILLLVTERDRPGDLVDVELLHSAQANGDVIWFFHAPSPRSRIGLSLGYHYNSVLKHGAGLAFQGEAALSDELVIEYTFGLALFPRGNAYARDALGRHSVDFNFPFGAGFQGGAGAALRFPL